MTNKTGTPRRRSSHRGRSAENRATRLGNDLEAVHRSAVNLLAQHELSDWSVFWAYSIEKADGGGVTHGHAKRIVFSAAHMAVLTVAERQDAVRHEVAHAIVGVAAEHSAVWEKRAIELGGSGAVSLAPDARRFPWYWRCPVQHLAVSVNPPDGAPLLCEDPSHGEPVPMEPWKKNAKSRAFDPGVRYMAERFPEPASTPGFGVGDMVHVIPFGSAEFDNAPLTVLEVGERDYLTRHIETGVEHRVRHEMVAPESGASPDSPPASPEE